MAKLGETYGAGGRPSGASEFSTSTRDETAPWERDLDNVLRTQTRQSVEEDAEPSGEWNDATQATAAGRHKQRNKQRALRRDVKVQAEVERYMETINLTARRTNLNQLRLGAAVKVFRGLNEHRDNHIETDLHALLVSRGDTRAITKRVLKFALEERLPDLNYYTLICGRGTRVLFHDVEDLLREGTKNKRHRIPNARTPFHWKHWISEFHPDGTHNCWELKFKTHPKSRVTKSG